MKKKTAIALIVIVLFAGFAAYSFRSALNPYVSFAEAQGARGSVQVVGYLTESGIVHDLSTNQLRFTLKDKWGTEAHVVYVGVKPNNMEHAESVVVAGSFKGQEFHARRLLVKCPSKYEGKGGSQ